MINATTRMHLKCISLMKELRNKRLTIQFLLYGIFVNTKLQKEKINQWLPGTGLG